MKTNIVIMWVICVFFLAATVVYVWFHIDAFGGDINAYDHMGVGFWAGVITMLLTSIFGAFLAVYLNIRYKKQGGELPEDIDHSVIDDGDPEIGFYSPWSWWPVTLAAALALVVIGIAVGFWIAFYAIPLVVIGLVGHTLEYSRGNHHH